jgi:hypothetical protein
MRKLFLLIVFTITTTLCLGQKNAFSPARSYKVEGYVLIDRDTIQGYISIPIDGDEVNYSTLTKQVTFIDRADRPKKYKPNDLKGFGLQKDDILSHYVSVAKSANSVKSIFLKKVVEGKAMLLVEKIDRAAGYRNQMIMTGNGFRSAPTYQKEINKNVYYLKIGDNNIFKIPFNKKTASIAKKELKKLLVNLPDSFASSDEQVDFSAFIKLLEGYNADSNKEDYNLNASPND